MMEEEPKVKSIERKRSAIKKSNIHEDLIRLKKLTCNQPRYDHEPKWMKLKNYSQPMSKQYSKATLSPKSMKIGPREVMRDETREQLQTIDTKSISSYTHAKKLLGEGGLKLKFKQPEINEKSLNLKIEKSNPRFEFYHY